MTHEHEIKSSGAIFFIDPKDKGIYKQSTSKRTLIQGDHNSERFCFKIPRYIDGHDTSLCDKVHICYINETTEKTEKSEGDYRVTDMMLDSNDDNLLLFSWLISNDVTKHAGTLTFMIEFLCTNGEENAYLWCTDTYSMIICKAINNNNKSGVNE